MTKNITEKSIVFLRTRPANFFSSNYIDTRFNIYMLSESEIENLDSLINFCLESMRNKEEYLESAKKFRDNVEKLKGGKPPLKPT